MKEQEGRESTRMQRAEKTIARLKEWFEDFKFIFAHGGKSSQLAEAMGVNRRTATQMLAEFESRGWLVRPFNAGHTYYLSLPDDPASAEHKKCCRCEAVKSMDDFTNDATKIDGKSVMCKSCKKIVAAAATNSVKDDLAEDRNFKRGYRRLAKAKVRK